jgi:hypothetical protein
MEVVRVAAAALTKWGRGGPVVAAAAAAATGESIGEEADDCGAGRARRKSAAGLATT